MDDDDWDDAVWSTIDALESSHLQSRQATPAAEAQWACRSCTLLNSAPRTSCSVCNTPRGQVFAPAHADASGAASLLLSQPKKTVQATLPFGRAAGTPAASPAPTHGASSQRRSTPAIPSSATRATSAMPWPNRAPSARTAGSEPAGFPAQNCARAMTSERGDEDVDEPDEGVAAMAAIARLRHKGEDSSAKTRYLAENEAPNSRQQPQIDRDAATTFVYPTNYSVREYQLTIAEKALYHNTLVSLPTGLGKTLIASVVMYNFYRWFPQGQIVFMAPTKPLVAQQIGACHEIMGIPLSDTAELQGSVPPSTRKILWSTKRVFFCTPQSMQNDLQRGICRAERLVCLVVDEAHRATGNYAYCGVIQEVEKLTKQFRVLALSATPGAKFDVIQDVIRNLRITHIESRSADDADVKKYTHARQEEVIKCSLNSQIAETKALFLRVFERITQRLLIGNIIQHKDPERLTRWYVLQMRERFRASPNYQSHRSAESDLALLVTLLHARDLLTGHGLASYKGWLDDFVNEDKEKGKRISWSKKELIQSTEFQAMRLSLQHVGGTDSSSSSSHPKLLKLREVLHEHFQRHSAGQLSTRAIVFTQFRSSVQEIVKLLEPLFPLIKAQQFIGQGASGKGKESKGQTQKEQQEIVRKFRAGLFNVLVATCIAEEGLDIGEVDLIVSFDALTSPVRMIQRMGRTGRKRVGKVVILVTEGDEEKKLARSVASAKTVSRALTTFKSKFVYGKCARMIPHGISPQLSALEMEIPEFHASQIAGKQAAPRSTRADGDVGTERRDAWKLNELEKSLLRGKYMPTAWSDLARHEFFPICGSRKILLRRQPRDGQALHPTTRSRALMAIVRKVNGVNYDDEEYISNSVQTSTLDAYAGIGQYDDEVLEFSDPDNGRDFDSHMHFSPPCSAAPEPTTPVRSQGVQTPTDGSASQAKRSATIQEHPSVGGVRVSPLRQATITGKPSPSPSKRNSSGTGRKGRKKVDKPRDSIDESLLERGERLIARLNAMLDEQIKPPVHSPSPEPEPSISVEPSPAAEVQFQFPRIARRLKFDDTNELNEVPSSVGVSRENCVPLPPSLNDIYAPAQRASLSATIGTVPRENASAKDHMSCQESHVGSNENPSAKRMVPHITCPAPTTTSRTILDQELRSRSEPDEGLIVSTQSAEESPVVQHAGAVDADTHNVPRATKPKRSLALRAPIDALPAEAKSDVTSSAFTATRSTSTVVGHHSAVSSDQEARSRSKHNEVVVRARTTEKSPVVPYPVDVSVDTQVASRAKKPKRSLALRVSMDELAGSANTDATTTGHQPTPKTAPTRHLVFHKSEVSSRGIPGAQVDGQVFQSRQSVRSTSQLLSERQSANVAGTQGEPCSICCDHESFDDDPIVFCDGCNAAVHQFCYGIPILPSSDWFCDSCKDSRKEMVTSKPKPRRCALCPMRNQTIVMKQTQCGQWVHVQCFMWIPELQFHFESQQLRLGLLGTLDGDRKTLDCALCHSKRGYGIIQCAHKRCLHAFHVSCASAASIENYKLVQLDQDDGHPNETLFIAFCPLHNRSTEVWQAPEKPGSQYEERKSEVSNPNICRSPVRLNALSPSALLASQVGSSEKQRKQFRRLKRKYDTARLSDGLTQGTPPKSRSPWAKRVRRSQQHAVGKRAQAKALARMFIDDEVDAPSSGGDDDEDDDELNEEDRDFINDSSQLIYSPSVPSPVRRKKNKRNSLGDMRAIYARSLIESPPTPGFLKRGRGMLPSGGVISACLQELSEDRRESLSGSSFSGSQTREATGHGGAESVGEVIELLDESQTDLGVGKDDEVHIETAAPIPSFNLIDISTVTATTEAPIVSATEEETTKKSSTDDSKTEEGDRLREKIEANRLRALRLLEAKKEAAKRTNASVNGLYREDTRETMSRDMDARYKPESAHQCVVAAPQCSTVIDTASKTNDEPPSFSLLGSTAVASPVTKPRQISVKSGRGIVVYVQRAFQELRAIDILEECARAQPDQLNFEEVESLDVHALLSLRLAVIVLDSKAPETDNLLQHPMLQLACRVYKSFMLVIRANDMSSVKQISQSEATRHIRELPSCQKVIVACEGAVISNALLLLAREEASLGFGLPSASDVHHQNTVGGVDANFHERFRFFRSTGLLPIGSVISLSFRFDKFTVKQIPVTKFGEMHWRRMLPWISATTAKQLHRYFASPSV